MAQIVDLQNPQKSGPSGLQQISEAHVRVGFVRKVYGLVAAQITLTALVSALCVHGPIAGPLIRFAAQHPGIITWGTFIPTAVALLALLVFKRSHPTNLYLLGGFTLLLAFDVGCVCAAVSAAGFGYVVLQAATLTAALFIGLTIYAFSTKRDISVLGATLFPCLFALTSYGLLALVFPSMRTGLAGFMYSLAGAVLFCFYIVFDTFRILKVLGPDDYIEAAIQLYLDIVNLFLHILDILLKVAAKKNN